MSIYDDARATANTLLKKYGQSVVITHKSASTYDVSTGKTTVTSTNETGTGAIFEWSIGTQRFGLTNEQQNLIQVGDKQLLLSAVGITKPTVNDSVLANGINYVIIMIKELNPAGTVVMYECNVRS